MNRRNFLKCVGIIAATIVSGKATALAYFRQINPFKGKVLPGPTSVSLQDIKIDKHGRVKIRYPGADEYADTPNPPADTQCGQSPQGSNLFADDDYTPPDTQCRQSPQGSNLVADTSAPPTPVDSHC